jgi:hypothetical protein
MNTTLANHTGTFNSTAFSQAVVSVISATTANVTGIDVAVMSSSSTAARRLQSTTTVTNSSYVNVYYQVQHISGETTASDIQRQLEFSTANSALVTDYKTLSGIKTVSSAYTTTTGIPTSETQNIPVTPKIPQQPSKTPIVGIVAGVVVGVVAALLMLTVWCKRDTLRAAYSNRQQQHKSTKLPQSLPDHESGLLNNNNNNSTTNSFINNNSSSSKNNNCTSVFNSNGGSNNNVVESFNFPVKRKPSVSSPVLEETQTPMQQQQQQELVSQHSTGMVADSALADTDINDNTTATDDNNVGNALRGRGKQYKQQVTVHRSATTAATDSTASTVAASSIAAASSSTSTELIAAGSQSSSAQQPIVTRDTTTTTAAPADTVVADTTTTTAGTTTAKKSTLTSKASKLAKGMTSSISSVLKQGVKDHGSKAAVAVEAFGAVADHIPYVCHAWGLCNELIMLFSASAEISSNCAEVVSFAQHMQVHALHALHLLYNVALYAIC